MRKFIGTLTIIAVIVICCCCLILSFSYYFRDRETDNLLTQLPTQASTTEASPTAGPTSTETVSPVGLSRDNPIPVGMEVLIEDDMTMVISDTLRPANSIVRAGNLFNPVPDADQEYIRVTVELKCTKPSEDACSFFLSNITAATKGNFISPQNTILAGVENLLDSGSFFGGSSKDGYLFFIIEKGDEEAVLIYRPLLFGTVLYFDISK